MPRIIRTLIVSSLLIAGAVSPALAFGQSDSSAVAAGYSVHITGTTDGHSP